jgi:hypothetical protein
VSLRLYEEVQTVLRRGTENPHPGNTLSIFSMIFSAP